MKKTTRQQFKELVISAIHGLPYEEAVKEEGTLLCKKCKSPNLRVADLKLECRKYYCASCDNRTEFIPWGEVIEETSIGEYRPLPVTIGRVIQALNKSKSSREYAVTTTGEIIISEDIYRHNFTPTLINWQLIKENGQEATDDDQTDETIEALLKLPK